MISALRVGDLDRRITINQPVKSNDAETNQELITWSALRTVWAKRYDNRSQETFEADQQVAKRTVKYLVRYATDITEEMRVVDGSETFDIAGIEVQDRKSALILTCEKRDN